MTTFPIDAAKEGLLRLAEEVASNTPANVKGPKTFSRRARRTFLMGAAQRSRLAALEKRWPWPKAVHEHVPEAARYEQLSEAMFEAAAASAGDRAGTLSAAVRTAMNRLSSDIGDHEFFLQMANVELKGVRSVQVGRCRLFTMNRTRMARMLAEKKAAIWAKYPKAEDRNMAWANSTHGWAEVVGKAFAAVASYGSFAAAKEIAFSRVELALHFLKITATDWDDRAGVFVSVEGFGLQRRLGTHFARGPRSESAHGLILGEGPGLPLHINRELVELWGRLGLKAFNQIADAEHPGDLGRRIIRAVHLIGDATNVPAFPSAARDEPTALTTSKKPVQVAGGAPLYWARQERVLKFVMAAEALFNVDANEPVLRNVRRRWTALVEGSTRSLDGDFQRTAGEGIRVQDVVSDAYKVRSAVAHGGEAVATREIAEALLVFLRIALARLLHAWSLGLRSDDEMIRFFEACSLGSPVPAASRAAKLPARRRKQARSAGTGAPAS